MDISNNINVNRTITKANKLPNQSIKEPFSLPQESNIKFDSSITSTNIYSRKITLNEYQSIREKSNSDTTLEEFMVAREFMKTEEYNTHIKQERLKHGELRSTQAIYSIGKENIIFGDMSVSATDGISRYLVSGDKEQTLKNLFEAFGEGNINVEIFKEGKSPTNAEMFERFQGRSYYHHVMSDGLIS